MAFVVGNKGSFRLARTSEASLTASVIPADVSTSLNRVGLEGVGDELITGDQVVISTTDSRLLAFLASSAWEDSNRHDNIVAYVNVNEMGGVRFFDDFTDAVNNNRSAEKTVAEFSGDPLEVELTVKEGRYRALAGVTAYRFSTDRDALETTSLSDGFRERFGGLLTGSGSLDILYDYKLGSGVYNMETPLAIFQTLTRLQAGAKFNALLYVREPNTALGETGKDAVFYEFEGLITRAGIDGSADALVRASIDFVTTGSVYMKIGAVNSHVLKEDEGFIGLEKDLGYLLKELED